MRAVDVRPLRPEDHPAVLALTIATFGPFYEESFRPLVGEVVFHNRHGGWREDYARHVAGLVDPEHGKHAAVAVTADGSIAGYVAWVVEADARHGEIDILAVAEEHRRDGLGRTLAEHAIADAKRQGAEVVSIGTGGDAFHAPARALYEALGFTPFVNVIYTKAV